MIDFEHKSHIVTDAYHLAAQAHNGQVDKAGKPYILHPMRVASNVSNDDIAMTVALLHDVVEDTDVTLDELAESFPPEVTDALALLTHDKNVPYLDYIRAIRDSENQTAIKVKIADLNDNMDLTRLEHPTAKDRKRIREKYIPAMNILIGERR